MQCPSMVTMTKPPADLIGTAETAELLEVDRATVTRWAADGTLPAAVKLPAKTGAILFERAAVEALAAARRSPAEVSQ